MGITIVDSNPQWPVNFQRLKEQLQAALGELVVAIEHVGSTAVPGLAAKPIIDIDIVIESPVQLRPVVERLATIGYSHQGDLGIPGREAFASPAGEPARHVYVCAKKAKPLREHLAFRDYLRRDRAAVEEYADLKHRLAMERVGDRMAYTERKSAFVRQVLMRCEELSTAYPAAIR